MGNLLGWSTGKTIQAQVLSVGPSQSIGQPNVLATPDHVKLAAIHFLQLFSPY